MENYYICTNSIILHTRDILFTVTDLASSVAVTDSSADISVLPPVVSGEDNNRQHSEYTKSCAKTPATHHLDDIDGKLKKIDTILEEAVENHSDEDDSVDGYQKREDELYQWSLKGSLSLDDGSQTGGVSRSSSQDLYDTAEKPDLTQVLDKQKNIGQVGSQKNSSTPLAPAIKRQDTDREKTLNESSTKLPPAETKSHGTKTVNRSFSAGNVSKKRTQTKNLPSVDNTAQSPGTETVQILDHKRNSLAQKNTNTQQQKQSVTASLSQSQKQISIQPQSRFPESLQDHNTANLSQPPLMPQKELSSKHVSFSDQDIGSISSAREREQTWEESSNDAVQFYHGIDQNFRSGNLNIQQNGQWEAIQYEEDDDECRVKGSPRVSISRL